MGRVRDGSRDTGDLARLNGPVEGELPARQEADAQRGSAEVAGERESGVRAANGNGDGASLAGQLRRTFLLIGGLVGAAFVATALSFSVASVWLNPEFEECRQAKEAAADLNLAILDEETGLRGFLFTRDPHFLEPYYRRELAAARANEELDAHAAAVPDFAFPLARQRAAAERWQEGWAKPVAEMNGDGPSPSPQEGKALFDAYRREQTALAGAIARRTEMLSRRLHYAIGGGVALELAICAALILLVLRQHRALRDAIGAPVAALLRDIGRVRDGELVMTLPEGGPKELRELGAGLNDMVRAMAVARELAESRDALVRQHAGRLRQILDASREFSESLHLPNVVRSVSSGTMAVGGYDQVVVWLMADDQKGLREAGLTASALVLDETRDDTLAWRAAKSGRMAFEGPDGRVQFGDGGAAPVRARAVPLVVGARIVGALEARHMEARVPSGEAVELLAMLAAHAATALESARVNQIAEERSLTDPLTRLNNRRRLEEDLDDECNRCTRYGRPLAFVMLDVDNFKAFNDTHGHSRADVALQEVARVIGATVRTTDSAYRYGGEEFCVLLRETGAENAMHFAERLRERIEARFANSTAPRITASFGVAEISGDTATPRTLLEAADAAMYESKRTGRNRVVLSTPPPRDSSGAIAIAKPVETAESGTVPRAMTALPVPERQTSG
jgi:diguanylate cyclase (GGDEF)-like protein